MQTKSYLLLKIAAALMAAVVMTGCSLLKVSVSSGEPLSKEDMNTRMMTRGFYYDFAGEVSRAADSVAAASKDAKVRIASIRWKIRATRAGVSAAMQGIPDVALADMWILCRRMNEAFAAAPDSALFGPQSPVARNVAAGLDRRAEQLARQVLPEGRYELMARFVERFVRENPVTRDDDAMTNTTLAWVEFLRKNGVEHTYDTGSIAEVLSDVNDRMSGQTQQLSNSVGWSKDIFEQQWGQDSMKMKMGAQLDSLEGGFRRLVVVAENLPGISEKMLRDLNRQASQLIGTMNSSVDNAFADFDRQREELQHYVSQEREQMVLQLKDAGSELVSTALDAVPGLIAKVLLYLVLALVVLIGGPFALGFWLGGVRERARERKRSDPK